MRSYYFYYIYFLQHLSIVGALEAGPQGMCPACPVANPVMSVKGLLSYSVEAFPKCPADNKQQLND